MSEIKLRVLVVEDVPMTRQYLKTMLKQIGVTLTDLVGTLKEAMELFEGKQHDVVLLDIELPDGNGLEIVEKIKSINDKTRVIMVSGTSTPENVKDAVSKGAVGFLTKPFSPANLKDALIKALKTK